MIEESTCIQSRANTGKALSKHLPIYKLIPISLLFKQKKKTFHLNMDWVPITVFCAVEANISQ